MATSAEEVAGMLAERGLKIATAESTTGGYIGHLLNSVPGASKFFPGGVIAYNSHAKTTVLKVPPETIDNAGSVSAQTALAMAQGAREVMDTDIGVGETGIAGPTGGSDDKPRGTVFIAISVRDGYELAERYVFDEGRERFKEHTAEAVLSLVRHYLKR